MPIAILFIKKYWWVVVIIGLLFWGGYLLLKIAALQVKISKIEANYTIVSEAAKECTSTVSILEEKYKILLNNQATLVPEIQTITNETIKYIIKTNKEIIPKDCESAMIDLSNNLNTLGTEWQEHKNSNKESIQ